MFDWLRRALGPTTSAPAAPLQLAAPALDAAKLDRTAARLDALAAQLAPHGQDWNREIVKAMTPAVGNDREQLVRELTDDLLDLDLRHEVCGDPQQLVAQARLDGLSSMLADLKLTSGRLSPGAPENPLVLDLQFCDALYRGNRMAQRIINVLPGECTRRGWEVTYGDDAPDGDPLGDEFKRLGVAEGFLRADTLARKDGGAALFLGIDDGGLQSEPVNEASIQRITHSTLIERWFVTPLTWEDRFDQPGFAEPVLWQVTPYNPGGAAVSSGPDGTRRGPLAIVHTSRLIVWGGVWLPPRLRAYNAFHDDSVLQACWRVLMDYRSTMKEVSGLARSFSTAAVTLHGLAKAIGGGHADEMLARLAALNAGQGKSGMFALDEGEKLEYAGRTVAGLADLIQHQKEDLAGAAEMPMSMLFGQQPGGLAANDQGSARNWYNRVSDRQTSVYLPRLMRLGHLLALAQQGPCHGEEPEGWGIRFNPLEQMTDAETATLRLAVAQTMALYVANGVLDPSEVRESIYGGEAFSQEITLDPDKDPSAAPPVGDATPAGDAEAIAEALKRPGTVAE